VGQSCRRGLGDRVRNCSYDHGHEGESDIITEVSGSIQASSRKKRKTGHVNKDLPRGIDEIMIEVCLILKRQAGNTIFIFLQNY